MSKLTLLAIQSSASTVEQMAILNAELAKCVLQLDDFAMYMKCCSEDARAELQMEQDLLEDSYYVRAGLLQSQASFNQDTAILQKELERMKNLNENLVR